MNILFDIRTLGDKHLTGVGFYTFNVLEKLLKKDRDNRYFLFMNKSKAIDSDIQNKLLDFEKKYNAKILRLNYPNKIFNLLVKLKLIKIDELLSKKFKIHFDLYFAPNINYINISDKIKLILTVHDLSFVLFPEFFNFKQRLWHKIINYRKLYQRADKILAVSGNTKLDLMDLKINSEKIKVIKLGINKKRFEINNSLKLEEIKKKYDLKNNYILFLGTLEPRKNIQLVLAAFKKVLKDNPELELLLVGRNTNYSRKLLVEYSELKDKIKILNYIEDKDKKYLYNLALLTVYPSIYEGFGLPVLEAMACNCPVIVGRNSSLLENFADFVSTVDIENSEELKDLICYTIDNREEYIERLNKINWQDYSWENYADEFLKMIKTL